MLYWYRSLYYLNSLKMDFITCDPFKVPIARVICAQAYIDEFSIAKTHDMKGVTMNQSSNESKMDAGHEDEWHFLFWWASHSRTVIASTIRGIGDDFVFYWKYCCRISVKENSMKSRFVCNQSLVTIENDDCRGGIDIKCTTIRCKTLMLPYVLLFACVCCILWLYDSIMGKQAYQYSYLKYLQYFYSCYYFTFPRSKPQALTLLQWYDGMKGSIDNPSHLLSSQSISLYRFSHDSCGVWSQ